MNVPSHWPFSLIFEEFYNLDPACFSTSPFTNHYPHLTTSMQSLFQPQFYSLFLITCCILLFLFYIPSLPKMHFPPALLPSSRSLSKPSWDPIFCRRLTQLCRLMSTSVFAIFSNVNFIYVSLPVLASGAGTTGTCWAIPGIMKQAVEEQDITHLLERAYESYFQTFHHLFLVSFTKSQNLTVCSAIVHTSTSIPRKWGGHWFLCDFLFLSLGRRSGGMG